MEEEMKEVKEAIENRKSNGVKSNEDQQKKKSGSKQVAQLVLASGYTKGRHPPYMEFLSLFECKKLYAEVQWLIFGNSITSRVSHFNE